MFFIELFSAHYTIAQATPIGRDILQHCATSSFRLFCNHPLSWTTV
jgi:hypothetical protein